MKKRSFSFAFVFVAAFLAVASFAFACTNYVGGELTIQGDQGGSSVTVGSGRGMGPLGGPSICSIDGQADASAFGGSVDLTVAASADPGPAGSCESHTLDPFASQLPDGTYDVTYVNGPGFNKETTLTPSRGILIDCMHGGSNNVHVPIVSLGTMTINTSGAGSGSYNLPDSPYINNEADESGICISDEGGQNGILGPVNIVL